MSFHFPAFVIGVRIDIFDPKSEQAVPFDTLFSGIALQNQRGLSSEDTDPENRLWIHTKMGRSIFSAIVGLKDLSASKAPFPVHHSRRENVWLGWENNLAAIDPSGKVLEQVKLPYQVVGIWAE